MVSITADLTARVVIITIVFSTISYFVTQRDAAAIPILFVLFGAVILISVLFDLWRFHVMDAKAPVL